MSECTETDVTKKKILYKKDVLRLIKKKKEIEFNNIVIN